jgi:hypothetical protein
MARARIDRDDTDLHGSDLELKEKMLAKTTPPVGKAGLFRPDDALLAFLKGLYAR